MGIRVLVVDDSALMRQVLSRFLTEAGMEVVGTARDGEEGLEKALALKPDVITLDVEMPRKDGLTMLEELMAREPMPVVMVSSLTQKEAPAAIRALELGAMEVVAKPGGAISLNLGEVREEIIRKVRGVAMARMKRERSQVKGPTSLPRLPFCRLVVVGSSTGGPQTLVKLFSGLPGDFPAPVVVVQHMPRGLTASLAARLDNLSPLSVREAEEGVIPRPGEVWVAPGGRHLVFRTGGAMAFSDDPPVHGVKPAVDVTLDSAVEVFGGHMVAVILTGMGMDGAKAALKLRERGGFVMAQSEGSSIVYGMPRAAVELGAAHVSLDVEDMPAALLHLVGKGRSHG